MTEINEKSSPLTGWVVVCVDGLRLVGSIATTGGVNGLSPAYEYRCDVVGLPIELPGGKGAFVPQLIRQMVPIHGDPGIDAYPLPHDARCIGLDTLTPESQREWLALIESCRSGIERANAQRKTGIQLVGR